MDIHRWIAQTGKPRIGDSVIHSPTATTTYIDALGQDETHTIMRAELVAIHVALDKYKNDKWVGIFTDSQASLPAIQNQLQRPSHTTHHHHKPLIGLPRKLNKIRGHTKIRGNYLADTAAKLVINSFEDIPDHQKLTNTVGKQVERPPVWVMYTSTPPPHQSHSPQAHTQPPYAPRGGPSRKTKGDACTSTLKPRIKYA